MIPPPPRSTLTDTLLPCPTLFRSPGEVWFIEIRGPNVFKGYWRMPEKPAAEFREGYFVSGDMGRVDQRGYVSIVGREKDLIIAGGFNVYPAEVEDAIGELPVVREVAVIGVPHPDLGEAVVAVGVPREHGFSDGQALCAELGNTVGSTSIKERSVQY